MLRYIALALMLAGFTCLCGCGSGGETAGNGNGSNGGNDGNGAGVDEARLATPQSSIEYQFELLKAGDFETLKACVTDRQRERMTAEAVNEGKQRIESQGTTVEELVGAIEEGEYEGKKTATIKMKSGGRTLTTLIETDGKWLSDTIWFN